VALPRLEDINGLRPGVQAQLLLIGAYIDGFDMDHFEYGDFAIDNIHAWAQGVGLLTR
jgi:hypothetical protein